MQQQQQRQQQQHPRQPQTQQEATRVRITRATRRLSNTVGPRIGLLHCHNPARYLGQLLQHCAQALCGSSLQSGFTRLRGCSTMLIPLCHNPAERLGQPLQHSSKPCEGPHCNQILLCFMVGHIEQADKGVHDPAVVTVHKLW